MMASSGPPRPKRDWRGVVRVVGRWRGCWREVWLGNVVVVVVGVVVWVWVWVREVGWSGANASVVARRDARIVRTVQQKDLILLGIIFVCCTVVDSGRVRCLVSETGSLVVVIVSAMNGTTTTVR